jgi:DNA-binding Lrp family transcriptional regulator
MVLSVDRQALIGAIQDGLPLSPRPYRAIAQGLGVSEQGVIEALREMLADGTLRRLGVVVRHRELGYRANAMVVWDVPDERVAGVGERLSQFDCVTLCYRRPRRLPLWSYNLFSMIHGRSREAVRSRLEEIVRLAGLEDLPREVLFSARRFKQRGARYAAVQPRRAAGG